MRSWILAAMGSFAPLTVLSSVASAQEAIAVPTRATGSTTPTSPTEPRTASPTAPASDEVSGAQAGSSEPQAEALLVDERHLGGHRLVLPEGFPDALIVTTFVFGQGLGALSFSLPDQDGNKVDGSIFMLTERLGVHLGFWNRVAGELDVSGFAGVGGDLESVVLLGGFADFDMQAGAKARLFTLETAGVQLTAGAFYRYTHELAVRPMAILENAVTEGKLKVLQKTRADFVVPTLAAAWGFGPVGVQATLAPSLSLHEDRSGHQLTVGASGTFDLGYFLSFVPLAANLEYEHMRDLDDPPNPLDAITAGVFYSGRPDLQLGLRYYTLLTDAFDLKAGSMVMAYFF